MRSSLSFLLAASAATAYGWSFPHGGYAPSHWPHAWQPQGWGQQPVVRTSGGLIEGLKVELPDSSKTAHEYLGIPFAQTPPVRFEPPRPLKKHYGVLNATSLPPSCIQQFNYPEISRNFTINTFASPPPPSESEDCLYLNVYTPSSPAPKGGFPVLFWIYGGALQFGYSGLPYYDGSYFAAHQDVIVVTTNYRTNVFGFPGAPELKTGENNLGFLDQRQALSWTSQNIAAFGGDPSKITVFGESAGGYSVKQLIAVPPKPLNFRAAILESEATDAGNGTAAWESLIAALNCTAGESELTCARAAPATTLKSIVEHGALTFAPISDNITQSPDVKTAITSGTAADVPIIIGTNGNDGSIFALEFGGNLDVFINETFRADGAPQAYIDLVLAQYPRSQFPSDIDIVGAIITDVTFQCPAAQIANLTAARGLPVYRYIFNATFANTQPPAYPFAGAWHSSEIPLVFKTYNRTGATVQEGKLSQYMNTAWANFAKNPTGGPAKDWPALGKAMNDVQTFQPNATAKGVAGPAKSAAVVDAMCPVFAPALLLSGL